MKVRRKWTWKIKQCETIRNVKSNPDIRLINTMSACSPIKIVQSVLSKKQIVEEYEWLLAILGI